MKGRLLAILMTLIAPIGLMRHAIMTGEREPHIPSNRLFFVILTVVIATFRGGLMSSDGSSMRTLRSVFY